MTDTWTEEHVPASDLWTAGKSMGPMTHHEELEAWRKTTRALDSLCGMATGLLLEPLELALADALGRAREEERRAEDRLTRPEGAHLGPSEEERLRALMRRSDALGNALDALEQSESAYPDTKAEYVGVVREDFERARKERHLEALEHVAAELEKLRMLREHEMGVRIVDEEGELFVRPAEEGQKRRTPRSRVPSGAWPFFPVRMPASGSKDTADGGCPRGRGALGCRAGDRKGWRLAPEGGLFLGAMVLVVFLLDVVF